MVASSLSAGQDITLTARTGDVVVQAAKLSAGDAITLDAAEGQVQMLTATSSASHAETHSSSNLVRQQMRDRG